MPHPVPPPREAARGAGTVSVTTRRYDEHVNTYDPSQRSESELYAPTRPEPAAGQPYSVDWTPSGADPWAPTTSLHASAPSAAQTQPYAVGYEQYPAMPRSPEPTYQAYPPPQAPPSYPLPAQPPAPAYRTPAQPVGWYPVAHPMPMVPPKSAGVAYLLWFFFGFFGVHHFYLGRTGWGVAYLLGTLLLGWMGLGILLVLIGCFIDLFLIPSYTRDANRRLTGYPY